MKIHKWHGASTLSSKSIRIQVSGAVVFVIKKNSVLAEPSRNRTYFMVNGNKNAMLGIVPQ
jgi:hypothetical protein